jgi:hypothetical protein
MKGHEAIRPAEGGGMAGRMSLSQTDIALFEVSLAEVHGTKAYADPYISADWIYRLYAKMSGVFAWYGSPYPLIRIL